MHGRKWFRSRSQLLAAAEPSSEEQQRTDPAATRTAPRPHLRTAETALPPSQPCAAAEPRSASVKLTTLPACFFPPCFRPEPPPLLARGGGKGREPAAGPAEANSSGAQPARDSHRGAQSRRLAPGTAALPWKPMLV